MKVSMQTMTGRVRTALDEIPSADLDSDFDNDFVQEAEAAIVAAATELCAELPEHLLMPVTMAEEDFPGVAEEGATEGEEATVYPEHAENDDGTGTIALPPDFLRLVSLRLSSWQQDVRQLTEPASNEGRMQACGWTRGTPQKPRAMLGATVVLDGVTRRLLEYYTAGKAANAGTDTDTTETYDHTIERLAYVPVPSEDNGYLVAGLTDRCIPIVAYRACAILLEGKQHGALADRFRQMSKINQQQQ